MVMALSLARGARRCAGSLPFRTDAQTTALSGELSGESAKRNLEGLSRLHRMRGSREFRRASELVVGELRRYGSADPHIEQVPADGEIFSGTQRSRPAWNAAVAELR